MFGFDILPEKSPIAVYDDKIQKLELEAEIKSEPPSQFISTSYFSRVKRAKFYYDTDPLISGLVDLVCRLANSYLDFTFYNDDGRHNEVFNFFKKEVNSSVINVLPSLDLVNKEIFKHLLLSGKSDIQWEWEQVKINGAYYTLPTKIYIHPSLSVKLETINAEFYEGYNLWVSISDKTYSKLADDPNYSNIIQEFSNVRAIKLPADSSFSLRYNYSTNDGTYPIPFLTQLFEDCEIRRSLRNMDLSLSSSGILLLLFTYGSLENPLFHPKDDVVDENGNVTEKGDVTKLKEYLSGLKNKFTGGLALPKHISLDIKQADLRLLFDTAKWVSSTTNILNRFGIFFPPVNLSGNFFNSLNVDGFISLVTDLQKHVEAFYVKLGNMIIDKNSDKLSIKPDCRFNRVNLYTDKFREQIIDLWKASFYPSEELAKAFGKDFHTLISQLKEEKQYVDLFKALTRISFTQSVVKDNKEGGVQNGRNEDGEVGDGNGERREN